MKKATSKKPHETSAVNQCVTNAESSPRFYSLRKKKSCKHHPSSGKLPTNSTTPYNTWQQFQTLDSHNQPYYENITDSIQIHEASMSANDPSSDSFVDNDELHIVNTDNDHQLQRNSLYRSDSGISNSSYDCTTPVPAPRPNSRKCQSVPVYMNLPGKFGHPTRWVTGTGRSHNGRSDVSLLNEIEQCEPGQSRSKVSIYC